MSKGVNYPEEFHEWFRATVPGKNSACMQELIRSVWGLELSMLQIETYKKNHKCPSGVAYTGKRFSVVTDEQREYIAANCNGVALRDMAEILRREFGSTISDSQLKTYYRNHGFCTGRDTRFREGQVGINRGKRISHNPAQVQAQFKLGHVPDNKTDIGTLRQRRDGSMWRKVGPGSRDWRGEHRLVWEAAHGPLKPGEVIIFLDGDISNCALENLRAVPRRVALEMTRRNLRFPEAELTRTGALIAELRVKAKEKGRTDENTK